MALNINGTTGISGVDGSVSAPAVTGTDSNTGITFPSADTIKFSTGGVERMSITNSGITGITTGITQADQWRLTSDFDATGAYITANWERNDTDFAYIGSGMTESSGVFTFPATGIYLIMGQFRAHGLGSIASYVGCDIHVTTDNSNYTNRADNYSSQGFTNGYATASTQCFFDVTDTSTHKVKMYVSAASSMRFNGDTNKNNTCLTFIRLGDT